MTAEPRELLQDLTRRRKACDVTQGELARLAGVSPSLICKIDCGQRTNITLESYQRICRALLALEARRDEQDVGG